VDANRFLTHSLQDPRLTRILAAAIDAVEPGRIVREWLEKTQLPEHDRLFLLGIGKAAEPMTMAAAAFCKDFTDALIVTKHSLNAMVDGSLKWIGKRVTIMEAGHPVPDDRSLAAGQAVTDFISRIQKNDLLICLISGGGSALVISPRGGLSLTDLQILTKAMLANGANIDEINVLRSQLDLLKGGGLAAATKGKLLSLILSDVIGDHLDVIASGLTVENQRSAEQIRDILKKYDITRLLSSLKLKIVMSEKELAPSVYDHTRNVIVANNKSALQAAKEKAVAEGFFADIINTNLQGEARVIGKQMAETLRATVTQKPIPFCLISGGETTVTIQGFGKGGRNQELALSAVELMGDVNNGMLISLATDGNDGPTDAAGAVVNGETFRRAKKLGMSTAEYLTRNDSFSFFDSLGDLLKPGYTGTNVNDLIFLFGL
jgi:glycerate 2-kinase